MPRDSSGNYTLPSGNPVVSGTTVDSSWANNTMNDIKTELQDSLSRSGKGGMISAFKFADGSAAAPGLTFTSETSSGIYRAGTNDVRVSIAGSDRVQFRNDATDPFRIWSDGAWAILISENTAATITAAWVFSGSLTIPEATVTAHEDALSITESQISDLQSYLLPSDIGTSVQAYDADTAKTDVAETVTANWTFSGVVTLDAAVTTADYGTGGRVKDGTDTARPVGFNVMPLYEIDSADAFDLAHNGMLWHTDGASTIAFTCNNDGDIPVGATYVIANESSSGTQTIEEGSGVTLRWFDGSTSGGDTGNRTLASGGVCTVYKYSDTEFFIWGNGLS